MTDGREMETTMPEILTQPLDGLWKVERANVSPLGFIATLTLRNVETGDRYELTRFDRGKLHFIDPAPAMSTDARRVLAVALAEIARAA